jgi:hypothetical protein
MTPAQWRSGRASSSTRQMFPRSEAAGVILFFDTLALYEGYICVTAHWPLLHVSASYGEANNRGAVFLVDRS